MAKKPGRKAFKGLAPKGYRIRMMEPGEAEALLAIHREEEAGAAEPTSLADFVRFLLSHEIFVAIAKRGGHPVGFAAARSGGDFYWLAEHRVLATHRRQGIGRSLITAVTQRARWFDYRAVCLLKPVDIRLSNAFCECDGFMMVSRKQIVDILANQRGNGMPKEANIEARGLIIKWL